MTIYTHTFRQIIKKQSKNVILDNIERTTSNLQITSAGAAYNMVKRYGCDYIYCGLLYSILFKYDIEHSHLLKIVRVC